MVSLRRSGSSTTFASSSFASIVLEAAHGNRRRRHEAVAIGGLAGLDAVDGEFHHVGLFGLQAEGGDDGMQRPHPLQRAWPRRALAPAHRFRPREGADDHRQHLGEHVQRGAAGLLDQRDIEIALLGIALDLCLIDRGKPGGLEKARDRRVRPADARSPALFLQVGLPRRNAVHRQRQPPRRRERLRAFIDQPLGDELVGDHAAQIVGRLRLHPRGNFFGEKFEQKIGHQWLLSTPRARGAAPLPLAGRGRGWGAIGVHRCIDCRENACQDFQAHRYSRNATRDSRSLRDIVRAHRIGRLLPIVLPAVELDDELCA